MNFAETAVSFLFPRRCPVCDEVIQMGSYICPDCVNKIEFIKEPACKKCGKPLENHRKEYCSDCQKKQHFYHQGKAVFVYEGGIRQSMYRFKYSNKREYADYYAKEAARHYKKWILYHEIEVLVPIPMYRKKERQRGYNQATVFAKKLGKELGIPVDTKLVKRIKNTTPQKELNDTERKSNLKGAFQLVPNIVKYRKILLLDDIYTTGSTMDAVSEILLTAGATEVYFISISIGEGY